MTKRELGDDHESHVAKVLKGRVQLGSGAVKVPTLRGDVIADPLMIECKATSSLTISFLSGVWSDVKKKARETVYSPAYALRVFDGFGNPFDVICLSANIIDPTTIPVAIGGKHGNLIVVKKTKKIDFIPSLVKNRQYVILEIETTGERLVMMSLVGFYSNFKKWKEQM